MSKSHITTAASTTLLVSPRMEGLDLLGVKEPEDEILHQPRPRTVTTTPTTPATLSSPQSELTNRHNHSGNACHSSSQHIHQRKSEKRYVYLLVHIHRYTEVAHSLGREPFTFPQESE